MNNGERRGDKGKRERIVAIRKVRSFYERFSGGRHDCVDGSDCAPHAARRAEQVAGM